MWRWVPSLLCLGPLILLGIALASPPPSPIDELDLPSPWLATVSVIMSRNKPLHVTVPIGMLIDGSPDLLLPKHSRRRLSWREDQYVTELQ